jgi:phosphate transport system ATP-binding protein
VSVAARIEVQALTAWYGDQAAVADVSLSVQPRRITAFIGPSGSGKSTLLRCLNGMHLVTAGARVTGAVNLDGTELYAPGTDLAGVRRRLAMIFQRPNPFPARSIRDNVSAGLTLSIGRPSAEWHRGAFDDLIERCLTQAGLWKEVVDRLDRPAGDLSGGQQQRLCIARALAVEPEALLLDEPTSSLDPVSTAAVEETLRQLTDKLTIVLVTHDLRQASRLADTTAFLAPDRVREPGRVLEVGATRQLFTRPRHQATADYVEGKVG